MTEQDQVELSALLDGELELHEAREVLDEAMRSDALQSNWNAYALIGDCLRGESVVHVDVAPSVMTRLRDEPVVLSPGNLRSPPRRHALMALAASLAGVAVVGWMALKGHESPERGLLERSAALSAPQAVALAGNESAGQLKRIDTVAAHGQFSEYLIAHHTQAATFRLGDSPEHVRSIALTTRYNQK